VDEPRRSSKITTGSHDYIFTHRGRRWRHVALRVECQPFASHTTSTQEEDRVMQGKTFSFQVHRESRAAAAKLFRLVSDGGRWSDWAKPLVPHSSWVIEGDPAPGGVGAIRKLGLGPLGVTEQTVAYEQDRLHAYSLLTPAPMKDYQGEVLLTPKAEGGTTITWRGTFDERVPGTGKVLEKGLGTFIGKLADQLVKAAERS
jgi:hypothetical protein